MHLLDAPDGLPQRLGVFIHRSRRRCFSGNGGLHALVVVQQRRQNGNCPLSSSPSFTPFFHRSCRIRSPTLMSSPPFQFVLAPSLADVV